MDEGLCLPTCSTNTLFTGQVYLSYDKVFKSQGDNKVCRLTKFLYGLKQAPRQWNAKLSRALLKFEFKQSGHHHSLFIKRTTTAKPTGTPIDTNTKLTAKQYDDEVHKSAGSQRTGDDPLTNQGTYQRIIGKLLYLTMTRPDISFGVQTLRQFLQQPKRFHMTAALRIIRHVKNQPGQGVLMSNSPENTITVYCDAD